jgi:hypothetical protein
VGIIYITMIKEYTLFVVFCYVPKHLSSLANIYHHSMLHGGVALSKTFCNVPSSNLNFFGFNSFGGKIN